MTVQITNRDALATNPLRDHALRVVEAGYNAIDTDVCIARTVQREGDTLTIGGRAFDLSQFRSISIIGFGKASSKAAQTLETILGDRLTGGIVLDKDPLVCSRVQVFQGSHPQPTARNVEVSEKIATLAKGLTKEDLALVVVSGGGSSLLCWPQSECDQGARLYNDFLSAGGTITELNILRKHLSGMKGGGLAKLLSPASVVGLILCDVPGDQYDVVASGPTYFDETTIEEAQTLLQKYGITEAFDFIETPKDKSIFEHVYNVPIVSNTTALDAMSLCAKDLGYEVVSVGAQWYGSPQELVEKMIALRAPKTVVLGGGEPKMVISHGGGIGGRNEYVSALMIDHIVPGSVFVSFASDGIDNCSEAAGGIIDITTKEKAATLSEPVASYLERYDHDTLLVSVGAQIITGPTEANVSDLFFLINE